MDDKSQLQGDEALKRLAARGMAEEADQQLLIFARRCRELSGELAKASAILAAKDADIAAKDAAIVGNLADIARLRARLAEPRRAPEGEDA